MPRLVQIEEQYTPPSELLGRLKELDPTVELVYAGHDPESGHVWWLGSVATTDEAHGARKARALRILANEEKRPRSNPFNVRLAKLMLQGFALIERYTTQSGDPLGDDVKDGQGFPCSIIADFAERDWNYRKDGGEAVVQNKLLAPERRTAESNRLMHDKLVTDGRDEFVRTHRARRVYGYGT